MHAGHAAMLTTATLPSVRYSSFQRALWWLQLVDEAYQRWLVEEEGVVDDITAVVVKFIHAEG